MAGAAAAPAGGIVLIPRVLMVTGAYHPEVSGGARQCRELIRLLAGRVRFAVLTTTHDRQLVARNAVDGVPVYRIVVDPRSPMSRLRAAADMSRCLWRLRHDFDVLHVHAFSQKMIVLAILARLLRKKLVLTLHTGGHDAATKVRAQGRVRFWAYTQADLVTAVSPGLGASYRAAGLPADRFVLIPNGVDVSRFRPGDEAERSALRRELGLPLDPPMILFVGFFSREKRPDLLFNAWVKLATQGPPPTLVFVGATRSTYYEVDPTLAEDIQATCRRLGLEKHVFFAGVTHAVDQYFRAADVFALPSSREGLPTALIEAMASGLACVATRLPGSTDVLVDDGVNGMLVPDGDVDAWARSLRRLLSDAGLARALGRKARETAERHYSIWSTSERYLAAYQRLLSA